jgi:transketolase
LPAGTPWQPLEIGRIQPLSEGRDALLLASGLTVEPARAAAELLRADGLAVAVANVHSLKPFDAAYVRAAARTHKLVVTVENHSIIGGLGSAVAEVIAEGGTGARLLRLGVQDCFAEGASTGYLFEKHGLSAAGIAGALRSALAGNTR